MNWLREKTILRIKNLSCFFVSFVVITTPPLGEVGRGSLILFSWLNTTFSGFLISVSSVFSVVNL